MVRPMVSVVMPSLNQRRFIDASIASVLGQDYPELELIVMDGGSTDGTQDLLAKLARRDPRLRWRSEGDTGPAAALNKAIALVRGTVIGWLNSDDLYTKGAVSCAVAALEATPEWLMVYGHGEHVDAKGRTLEPYPTLPPATPYARFAEGCFICQPTMFFKRSAAVLLGPLDESFKCSFDFDYWLRAFRAFPGRIGFVDALQAQSRLHEDCLTLKQRRQVALEGMRLLHHYLGAAPKEWLLTYAIELLETPQADRGLANLPEHFRDTLQIVARWMDEREFALLQARIKELLHDKS